MLDLRTHLLPCRIPKQLLRQVGTPDVRDAAMYRDRKQQAPERFLGLVRSFYTLPSRQAITSWEKDSNSVDTLSTDGLKPLQPAPARTRPGLCPSHVEMDGTLRVVRCEEPAAHTR